MKDDIKIDKKLPETLCYACTKVHDVNIVKEYQRVWGDNDKSDVSVKVPCYYLYCPNSKKAAFSNYKDYRGRSNQEVIKLFKDLINQGFITKQEDVDIFYKNEKDFIENSIDKENQNITNSKNKKDNNIKNINKNTKDDIAIEKHDDVIDKQINDTKAKPHAKEEKSVNIKNNKVKNNNKANDKSTNNTIPLVTEVKDEGKNNKPIIDTKKIQNTTIDKAPPIKKKEEDKKEKVPKVGIVLLAILLLSFVYLVGVMVWQERVMPNTTIYNYDKDKTVGFAPKKDEILKQKKVDKIDIVKDDKTIIEIDIDDIEYINETVAKEGEPNIYKWPIEIFKEKTLTIEEKVDYNKDKLHDIIFNNSELKGDKEPVDATIEYNDDKGEYVIRKEISGNKVKKKQLEQLLENNLAAGETKIDITPAFKKAKVTSKNKDLQKRLKDLNKYKDKAIIFDFDDREYKLSAKEFNDIIDNEGNIIEDNLRTFIANIAIETDTYARPREFNATGIGKITVPGGIYGWQMNVAKTMDNVLDMINNGKSGKVKIEYNHEGNIRKKDDIGDTYVELDLSRQKMWYYKEGKLLVETPVVTGYAHSKNAATPTGVGRIWTKARDTYLKGNDAVTGVPYNVPVKYWMPIGWTGSGIHDTYYRDEYGKDIYKYDGSSSCINTPEDKVKKIFDNVEINTPVVVYESSTNYSPTEFEKQEMLRN